MVQVTGISSKFISYYEALISVIKRIYVLFWHNLSLDPRVRASPYDPPPENEVKMKTLAVLYYRGVRVTFLFMHIVSVITITCCLKGLIKTPTLFLGLAIIVLTTLGVICGTHRYWCHKSYNARPSLELFFIICHMMSGQFSIFHWVKLHRVHHKFSDTEADPHNVKRGFFFSQIGWQVIRRTPQCDKAMAEAWLDDLRSNRLIMFEHKFWPVLLPILSVYVPTAIPWYFWNENLFLSFAVALTKLVITQHITGTVNSLAHITGMRPFDKSIRAADSWIAWIVTFGDEGWHNYHHAFPCDYKASEFWGYKSGMCTSFIELCARLGLAYNLKTTSIEVATKRRQRTGDLSLHVENQNNITAHSKKNL